MKKVYAITLALVMALLLPLLSACQSGGNPGEEPVEPGPLTLGSTFEYGSLEITLSRSIGFTQYRSTYSDYDGTYVFYIPVNVKNIGESSAGLSPSEVTVYSPKGVSIAGGSSYSSYYEIEWEYEDTSIFSAGSTQPGVSVNGNLYIVYDVDGEYKIEFGVEEDKIQVVFDLVFDFDAVPQEQTEFVLGETLTVRDLEITFYDDISWDVFKKIQSSTMEGQYYFYLPVTVRNNSGEAQGFPYGFDIFAPNGVASERITWLFDDDIRSANDVLPGASQSGFLYVLYTADGEYQFRISDYDLYDDLTVTFPVEFDEDAVPVVQTVFGLDEKFVFDDLEITVLSDIDWGRINSRYSSYHNKDVLVLPITVTNIGDSSNRIGYYSKAFGPSGLALDDISYYVTDDITRTGDIRPGATLSGNYHILYDGDGEYVIEFSNYYDEVEVVFDVVKP